MPIKRSFWMGHHAEHVADVVADASNVMQRSIRIPWIAGVVTLGVNVFEYDLIVFF